MVTQTALNAQGKEFQAHRLETASDVFFLDDEHYTETDLVRYRIWVNAKGGFGSDVVAEFDKAPSVALFELTVAEWMKESA